MNEARTAIEKKINIALGALETLIVNDKNLDMALEAEILTSLVRLMRSLQVKGIAQLGNVPKNFFKFALRCLTSAIRTEPAVARVSLKFVNLYFLFSSI